MSHDHSAALPTIPFTNAESTAMRVEDVSAARVIAYLTCGIFSLGTVLYVVVLTSAWMQTLLYSTR